MTVSSKLRRTERDRGFDFVPIIVGGFAASTDHGADGTKRDGLDIPNSVVARSGDSPGESGRSY